MKFSSDEKNKIATLYKRIRAVLKVIEAKIANISSSQLLASS